MKCTEGLADKVIRAALQLGIKEFCFGKVRVYRAVRCSDGRWDISKSEFLLENRGGVPRGESVS